MTNLYWVDGRWPGQLAVALRPRGGDWREDDIANWKRSGVHLVLSLLTLEEEKDLDLAKEAQATKEKGMDFLSLPIPDRQVPLSETEVAAALEDVNAKLTTGKNVLVHCRQGIGRSGLVAACVLIRRGVDPQTAVARVTAARGIPVPETTGQRQWIDHYAKVLASPGLTAKNNLRVSHIHS